MSGWIRRHALWLNLGFVAAIMILLVLGSRGMGATPSAGHDRPEAAAEGPAAKATSWQDSVKMFAAALAISVTAVATAFTQSRIGAAGVGALAENPKLFVNILIYLVIPETMVILGFVIAALILF